MSCCLHPLTQPNGFSVASVPHRHTSDQARVLTEEKGKETLSFYWLLIREVCTSNTSNLKEFWPVKLKQSYLFAISRQLHYVPLFSGLWYQSTSHYLLRGILVRDFTSLHGMSKASSERQRLICFRLLFGSLLGKKVFCNLQPCNRVYEWCLPNLTELLSAFIDNTVSHKIRNHTNL